MLILYKCAYVGIGVDESKASTVHCGLRIVNSLGQASRLPGESFCQGKAGSVSSVSVPQSESSDHFLCVSPAVIDDVHVQSTDRGMT